MRARRLLCAAGQAAVEHSDERVEALAQFQQSCILQALRFPALQRLVYSTCRWVNGWGGWVAPCSVVTGGYQRCCMLGGTIATRLCTDLTPCFTTARVCSVHARENEGVVAAVLEAAAALGFQLEDPFPAWHRRGVAGLVEGADRLVRVDPDEDGTDGFFVAVFARQAVGGGGGSSGGGGGAGGAAAAAGAAGAAQQAKKRRQKQKG